MVPSNQKDSCERSMDHTCSTDKTELSSNIVIEALRTEHEKEQIIAIAKEAFPLFHSIFVKTTPHTLVAKHNGDIVGGVIMEILDRNCTGNGKGNVGIISWLFTSQSSRGLGAGQSLVVSAVEYLESLECDTIVTVIDGYNTSSSKIFSHNGFKLNTNTNVLINLGFKDYFRLWAELQYYFELGHFLWVKGIEPSKEESSGFGLAWVSNIAIVSLAFISGFGLSYGLENVQYPIIALLIFLIYRYLPLKLITLLKNEKWVYRGWHNGYPLSSVIALVFGTYLPMTGAQYPATHKWSYKGKLDSIGIGYSISATLMLVTLSLLLLYPGFVPEILWNSMFLIGISFLLFDILFIFTPFQFYAGKRIFEYNKWFWALFAVIALMIIQRYFAIFL